MSSQGNGPANMTFDIKVDTEISDAELMSIGFTHGYKLGAGEYEDKGETMRNIARSLLEKFTVRVDGREIEMNNEEIWEVTE